MKEVYNSWDSNYVLSLLTVLTRCTILNCNELYLAVNTILRFDASYQLEMDIYYHFKATLNAFRRLLYSSHCCVILIKIISFVNLSKESNTIKMAGKQSICFRHLNNCYSRQITVLSNAWKCNKKQILNISVFLISRTCENASENIEMSYMCTT